MAQHYKFTAYSSPLDPVELLRFYDVPPSRLDLPHRPTFEQLERLGRDVFEDGRVDPDELAAAVYLGRLAHGKPFEVRRGDRRHAAVQSSALEGEARRVLDAWAGALAGDDPFTRWLRAPHRSRSGDPPLVRYAEARLEEWTHRLIDQPSWRTEELRALAAAIPSGAVAGVSSLRAFQGWFAKLRCEEPSGWRVAGEMARRLWSCADRDSHYRAADRARPSLSRGTTPALLELVPARHDWPELLYSQHRPRPARAATIDEDLAEKLIALAGVPGLPNKSVHEDLYRLLEEAQFSAPETKTAFAAAISRLHRADPREASVLVLQAPDRALESGAEADIREAADGMSSLEPHGRCLVLARAPDGDLRLIEPSPGPAHMAAREVAVDPTSALARLLHSRAPLKEILPAALAYWEATAPGDRRVLVISSHGTGSEFGPSINDMVSLASFEESLAGMDRKPDLVAFDACRMQTDETSAALRRAGVRWMHASSVSISGQGFDYQQWFRDMAHEIAAAGELRMDDGESIGRWFDPDNWYGERPWDLSVCSGGVCAYDGALTDCFSEPPSPS